MINKSNKDCTVAIAGAGLLGRLLALEFALRGCQVTLYERTSGDEKPAGNEKSVEKSHTEADCAAERAAGKICTPENCCSTGGSAGGTCTVASCMAAGMLAPYSELEYAERIIWQLGKDSAQRWQKLLSGWLTPVFIQQSGTLVVAHSQDSAQLLQFYDRVANKLGNTDDSLHWVDGQNLRSLEPHLPDRFQKGIYLPYEGQIDNRQVMKATMNELTRQKVRCVWNTQVKKLAPYKVQVNGQIADFGLVIDCRGIGARVEVPSLRGVRGELIEVEAPEVTLSRPVRVMHPRYPIYVVPRPGHRFLIGATSIESEDEGPITVQSTLELLSAAFSLHSGFAEGRILESRVGLRPAFPDNLPGFDYEPGLMRVNGLYRHGFLLSPMLTQLAADFILSAKVPEEFASLFKIKEKVGSHN